jgi:hypothetical protein
MNPEIHLEGLRRRVQEIGAILPMPDGVRPDMEPLITLAIGTDDAGYVVWRLRLDFEDKDGGGVTGEILGEYHLRDKWFAQHDSQEVSRHWNLRLRICDSEKGWQYIESD